MKLAVAVTLTATLCMIVRIAANWGCCCDTGQIAAGSLLVGVVFLIFIPCIRVWRAIGYDRDPGVLMLIIAVFGITAYELATRYYFIPLLVSYGTDWWLARYERSELTRCDVSNRRSYCFLLALLLSLPGLSPR